MGRSLRKHCAYHNEDGHLTQGCRALKAHLEDLARQGHSRDVVYKARTREEQARLPQAPATLPPPALQLQVDGPRVINAIHSKVNENEHPHNDALVISLKIGECQELGLHQDHLEHSNSPMVWFNETPTWPLGAISLEVQTGSKKVSTEFIVTDTRSLYNVILGRPWLHVMRVVPSMVHQLLRFPTEHGIEEVRGIKYKQRIAS
ncbi:uncharacterized protein LOC114315568 [Camellia sinensis]|uniref:uncharacterized protein LOC114315568 n=1 Tax=Camellia sinensis TaxID=4442 RepID=UPI0010356775|nr:uncharacterized protein LOC114315568 [Camellia sinensis]